MDEQTLTMNRVIHAAVRRDLRRPTAALEAFPAGDRARAADLDRAWRNLVAELTHHHEQEDRLIWPVLGRLGVEADLLATMESEHATMHAALDDATAATARLAGTASAEDAGAALDAVRRATEATESHFAHEEADVEPRMLPLTGTEEWKSVEKQLRAGSPVRAGRFFAWVLDDADPAHAAYLRSQIPPPVVLLLSRVLGIGYQRSIAPVWRT